MLKKAKIILEGKTFMDGINTRVTNFEPLINLLAEKEEKDGNYNPTNK